MHCDKKVEIQDERGVFKRTVVCFWRCVFRKHFKQDTLHQLGHFMDENMSDLVTAFGYQIRYPSGDHTFIGHSNVVWDCVVSEDGRYLFTCSGDCTIRIWDLLKRKKRKEVARWQAHSEAVRCLALNKRWLVSGSWDRTIRVWNASKQTLERTLEDHSHTVRNVMFDSSGTRILSSSFDHSIREWMVHTGECIRVFLIHSDTVQSALYYGSKMIISGSSDGTIKLWDRHTTSVIRSLDKQLISSFPMEAMDLSLNCDATLLGCIWMDSSVTIYRLSDWEIVFDDYLRSNQVICFHPCNPSLFAVDTHGHSVGLYDLSAQDADDADDSDDRDHSGLLIHKFEDIRGWISNLCFSPDGSKLMSVADDHRVKVWDLDPFGI